MSNGNKALIRRFYELVDSGDHDAAYELISKDYGAMPSV